MPLFILIVLFLMGKCAWDCSAELEEAKKQEKADYALALEKMEDGNMEGYVWWLERLNSKLRGIDEILDWQARLITRANYKFQTGKIDAVDLKNKVGSILYRYKRSRETLIELEKGVIKVCSLARAHNLEKIVANCPAYKLSVTGRKAIIDSASIELFSIHDGLGEITGY